MSGHRITTPGRDFHERSAHAVADPELQHALRNLDRRLRTAEEVATAHPEWKERAAAIRRETLADLDGWLDRLERALVGRGMQVHRAVTADEARDIVLEIARAHGARTVVKGKSMATEEIDLGAALEAAGMRAIETDLGEYIVQLAGERPSHMITPAIHKTLPQIRDVLAREAGHDLPVDREALTAWARGRLRTEFLRADLGITGVNFAAADTGTLVLVTNEGNGRYCTTLPRVHVAVMPVEKVVPRLADVAALLPLLTSHATGQRLSNYVTMLSGPRGPDEMDGPDELHVVFLDNRRRALLGTPFEDMLACIRCGACLNVCPVYRHVSGHAYDAVLLGSDGQGADAAALGRCGRRGPAVRFDAVPRVQRRVSRADPARGHDRAPARRFAGGAAGAAALGGMGPRLGVAALLPGKHRARRASAPASCRGGRSAGGPRRVSSPMPARVPFRVRWERERR